MPNSPEGQRLLNVGLGLALAVGALAEHAPLEDNPVITPTERVMLEATPSPTFGPAIAEARPVLKHASRSRNSNLGSNLGQFEATCYNLSGTTASGKTAGWGKVAVDPGVIPLGTRLYIENYGPAVAADTGGAIDGRRIDIWKPTRAQCLKWGRRTVEVSQLP